jgi:hypothetical protein
MKVQFEFGLAAALFLSAPSLAFGQRAVRIATPQPSAHVRVASSTSVVTHARSHGAGSRTTKEASLRAADEGFGFIGGTPISIQQLLNPFPGFGFNLQSSPLLNQDLGIKALIDPATQARLALAERLLRETHFAPGFFLIDGGGSYVVPLGVDQDQEQQAQQPAPQQEQTASEETYEPAPTEAAAPLPDEGEFTLVLRDGKQFQAAAFTRMNDKIIYITPEGGRRSVAVADLDANATLRINQEHGTPLQLPL